MSTAPSRASIWRYPLLVIDVETTGLMGDHWAEVVQLGAVVVDDQGQELIQFETLVKPRHSWPPPIEALGAMAIHGIRPYAIDRAANLFEGWGTLMGTLAYQLLPYRPPAAITSYNYAFEAYFLQRRVGAGFDAQFSERGPCIQLEAAKRFPELCRKDGRGPSLSNVARELLGPDIAPQTHTALDDSRRAARVAIALEGL